MNPIGFERLRTLYSVLDGIPDVRFDLNQWVGYVNDHRATAAEMLQHGCNTDACAVGWAALYPPFNEEGFKIRGGEPRFKGHYGWDAVEEFFSVSSEEASDLFSVYDYDHEHGREARLGVMERIELLINQYRGIGFGNSVV